VVHRINNENGRTKIKKKYIEIKSRHTPHVHAQRMSSCRQNIALFDEKSSRKPRRKKETRKIKVKITGLC
jgi:hypothetical protein